MVIIGNTVSQPKEGATVGVCGLSSIATHSIQCSNQVRVQRGIWQKWKDFNGHFDYYIYHVNLHHVICIKRPDTQAALDIDLIITEIAGTKFWLIRIREAEWKPEKSRVNRSKHTWHAAAALKAVKVFSSHFNTWNVFNNCSTFTKGVIGFMADPKKKEECQCEPITDDFDKLSTFGEQIGVELMYMTSNEAREPIPPQEEDKEEPVGEHIREGPIHQQTWEENETAFQENDTRNTDAYPVTEGIPLSTVTKDEGSMKIIEKMNNE